MKSFAPKPWFAPQPVLIIGTYNKEGVANAMNAAWAGQWDMKEIMISMGNHVTKNNLKLGGEFTVAFATKKTMVASDFVGIVSAKNDPKKMEKTGWNIEKATMVNAAASIIPAVVKSYAVSMVTFSPAFFISAKVLVVIFFLSVDKYPIFYFDLFIVLR